MISPLEDHLRAVAMTRPSEVSKKLRSRFHNEIEAYMMWLAAKRTEEMKEKVEEAKNNLEYETQVADTYRS